LTPDGLDRLRLARTEGVGPLTYRRLLRRFPDPVEAIAALPELARAGGRRAPLRIPTRAEARREADAVAAAGGRMLVLDGPGYPPFLALLEDPPPVIAVLGQPDALTARAVALVGARNASANGMKLAAGLAEELARSGLVIVSGLARGIDTAAHRGAMRGGRTVACIAGGLDKPYPRENAALQAEIAEQGGAVVAEAPLGTAPQSRHFPKRNRVIAGLALGVVVVEAAPRSGSLITARLAHEAARELFAAPGSPLDPRCRGSNDLIRQGAHLTESAADVLANLPEHPRSRGLGRDPLFRSLLPEAAAEPAATPLAPPESASELAQARRQVVELLGASPLAVDDLMRHCQFSPAAVMAVLLELELAGRVETLPGNRVALVHHQGA
jgi:DNA processing protein